MMARKKSKVSIFGVVFLSFLAFCCVAAVAYYAVHKKNQPAQPVASGHLSVKPPATRPAADQQTYTIYLPMESKNGFYLAPVTGTTGAKGSILDKAVVVLLDTSKENGVAGNLIPKGTKLLSPIKIANGVAQVNLSGDFVNNFSGGSDQESLTLNSIVQTVIANSGGRASRVLIMVEGETVDSLGGHLDMTEPLVPDASMFKP